MLCIDHCAYFNTRVHPPRQNMRSKRDATDARPISKKGSGRSGRGKPSQDNAGELFVRYVTGSKNNELNTKDPFVANRWSDNIEPIETEGEAAAVNTAAEAVPSRSGEYTKFHLGENEMLMELLMHLQGDCPELMAHKNGLMDRVSKLYDKLV